MKVFYDKIKFDSQLEVEYYKHLKSENLSFIYHPKKKIDITENNVYTPDFIVEYNDRIEIVETKGYNQFSFKRDNLIHNIMKDKTVEELKEYVSDNGVEVNGRNVVYKKIKFLQKFGWVDFNFKNSNTISKKRKEKNIELESENKKVSRELRDYKKYFKYSLDTKLTKKQKEWFKNFVEEKTKELTNESVEVKCENVE